MRIISMVAVLPMLWTTIFPQHALASETIDTNTKIDLNTDIFNTNNKLAYTFEGYKAEEPVKTPEELKNEKILEKWKEKQESMWKSLPTEKFTVNASAYTAAADECGKNDGITASGIKVKENRTLACPPQYPFGAKVKIEGVGTLVCEDRGGAIKANHFDIYVETKKEAFAFGRRNLLAEVVE